MVSSQSIGGASRKPNKNDYCNGCKYLEYEDWPKEKCAARCMDKGKGKYFGRVVDLHPQDITNGSIYRPAWCKERKA